ncbi:ABC transporter substrate-binding protein [Haloglycomyces albus]|uniref:ABC transporter substrate-binding protein n=1 Tax=Haloglycomyces albus TaxID=526067 RepID=UPI00046CF735|nr:ABC transporter substrate-binding protein [Haloglycomyces albus]
MTRAKTTTSRAVGITALFGLVLTSCGAPDEEDTRGDTAEGAEDCSNYSEYGEFDGETVQIMSSIRDQEADEMAAAWTDFAECVNIDIQHEGTGDFETIIQQRVDGGSAPDIALFPQPGLMRYFADDMVPASDELRERAEEGWSEDWLNYATFDGTFYGAPHSGNAKSLIWYSPKMFADKGYEIPETWDDLMALSNEVAADGMAPWCVGFGSGDATGWVGTDWVEDIILREDTDLYDDWVTNDVSFTDPRVKDAFDKAGDVLLNDEYVYGGSDRISSNAFETSARPMLEDNCALHRQASFLGWPEDTDVSEDGDVFIFRFPETNAEDNRMLIGGEFVAGFNDDAATEAVRMYLASEFYHNNRLQTGPWTTARQGVDPSNATTAVNQYATEIMTDPEVTVRFDGSDLMPGEVGASVFWEAITDWVDGRKSTEEILEDIQAAWDDLE